MPPAPDVLIVGAGVVGAACALELARAGLSVAVLERGVVGGGATAAGMGHLVVMDENPAELALTRYSRALWADWADEADHMRCGTIWVAADEAEMAEARRKSEVYRDAGVECELMDADALHQAEPGLRAGLAGGLLVPGDGVVYPPRAAAVLLERSGARRVEGTAVALARGGIRLSDGTALSAGTVVLATGAWARDLAPELPIQPKKGHLAITDRYPGFVRHQLVELGYVQSAHNAQGDSVAFNVQPRPTGQVLVGSSRQPGCSTVRVEHGVLSRMLGRACAYLPGLADLSCVRTWTGVRASTPDGLPLIGSHPGRPGVWLATGHEGLGITTAPGTARLLAAQLLGHTPDIPAEPFLPARFAEVFTCD